MSKSMKPAKLPAVNYKKKRKSQSIPDQSMSIKEIVKRFVRGIPVDVVQRQGVYADQNEFDLEKVSRMDFDEKFALANELKQRNESVLERRADNERALRERQERERKEADVSKSKATGIGSLDNTMPVDTKLSNK